MLTHKREKDLGIDHLAQWYPRSELGVRATDQEIPLIQQYSQAKGLLWEPGLW